MARRTRLAASYQPLGTSPQGQAALGQIPAAARERLGSELRNLYRAILDGEQPRALLDLVARLGVAVDEQKSAGATAFRNGLLDALPGLRAFAVSLAVNPTLADDLVQETLLRAWSNAYRFQPGSNLKAWLVTILRNQFYTEYRKRKREVEDADGLIAGQLIVDTAQEHSSDLRVVWGDLAKLPPVQREAVMLVVVEGLTYEAAAALIGTQPGTMKSRVSRARAALASAL